MSGTTARRGFRYQDFYLLQRVLPRVREVLYRVWKVGGHETLVALKADPLVFGIESKNLGGSDKDAPWDVRISDRVESRLIEAKSGKIARSSGAGFAAPRTPLRKRR
jgi:hypothetical protein